MKVSPKVPLSSSSRSTSTATCLKPIIVTNLVAYQEAIDA
jgi:hypothetical protein